MHREQRRLDIFPTERASPLEVWTDCEAASLAPKKKSIPKRIARRKRQLPERSTGRLTNAFAVEMAGHKAESEGYNVGPVLAFTERFITNGPKIGCGNPRSATASNTSPAARYSNDSVSLKW